MENITYTSFAAALCDISTTNKEVTFTIEYTVDLEDVKSIDDDELLGLLAQYGKVKFTSITIK